MYYLLNPDRSGNPAGPFSLPQIKTMLDGGLLTKWHLAARDGDTEWITIERVLDDTDIHKSGQKNRLVLPKSSESSFPNKLTNQAAGRPGNVVLNSSQLGTNISFKAFGRGQPVTGWLVFLALGVFICPILYTYEFFNGLHDINRELGDASFSDIPLGFKLFIIFIMTVTVLLTCHGAYNAYLFFNKKIVLKKSLTWWLVADVASCVLGLCFMKAMDMRSSDMGDVQSEAVRSIICASIWIPYIWKSKQVNQAFIN